MPDSAKKTITILAIESSCDETAAAILRGRLGNPNSAPDYKILSSVVHSQVALHKKFGGVVPEVAARAHLQNILPVTQAALKNAGLDLAEMDQVAVTSGPGLIASLIVGTEFAKGLAFGAGKKMVPTNHMAGHLYSIFGDGSKSRSAAKFPVVALVVSGGHTMLMLLKNYNDFKVLGSTVDDAAGEAFDKVARLLGLPYPGGPEVSKLAERGKETIKFPRPMLNSKNFDFSFSGLKTAVLYYVRDRKKLSAADKANVAASFEAAVVDTLITKTLRAAQEFGAKTVSLSGGVAANKKLRHDLGAASRKNNLDFLVPEFKLCTDNAAMIAIAAYFRLRGGYKPVSYKKVNADSTWEL